VGSSIERIEANAFRNCKNLKTITIKSKSLKYVGKGVLKGTPENLIIKVPKSKKAQYKKLFKGKGNRSVKYKNA